MVPLISVNCFLTSAAVLNLASHHPQLMILLPHLQIVILDHRLQVMADMQTLIEASRESLAQLRALLE